MFFKEIHTWRGNPYPGFIFSIIVAASNCQNDAPLIGPARNINGASPISINCFGSINLIKIDSFIIL